VTLCDKGLVVLFLFVSSKGPPLILWAPALRGLRGRGYAPATGTIVSLTTKSDCTSKTRKRHIYLLAILRSLFDHSCVPSSA